MTPGATPQEIRTAYLRAKAAFAKDSSALYSLMDNSETQEILERIEEAYATLSHPEKRNQYDKQHGFLTIDQNWQSTKFATASKPTAIENSVPMDISNQEDDALIAPRTDFSVGAKPTTPHQFDAEKFSVTPKKAAPSPVPQPQSSSFQATGFLPKRLSDRVSNEDLQNEIEQQTEWTGPYLKRIREYRRVTIEELSEWTRISKTYLTAIEEENFQKLPSAVYVRGFIIQIAKVLKVPHESVAGAYMSRYYQSKPK